MIERVSSTHTVHVVSLSLLRARGAQEVVCCAIGGKHDCERCLHGPFFLLRVGVYVTRRGPVKAFLIPFRSTKTVPVQI